MHKIAYSSMLPMVQHSILLRGQMEQEREFLADQIPLFLQQLVELSMEISPTMGEVR